MTADIGSDRVFVLGLDGIPWRLLERWTSDGSLPNLARLVDEGAAGPLRSSIPPTTAVAWPSIVTGVGPDHHGIYSFRKLTSSYGHEVNTSVDRQTAALWDMHSPAMVANVPMTYPAQTIDGMLVAGMMAPRIDEEFTHPSSFAGELERTIPEYQIGLSWSEYAGRESTFLDDLSSLVSATRQLMRRLMDEDDWRLFFYVYTAPDRLQHLIWDESVIYEHYRELDDIVGEVMAYVEDKNATLYVVSDHGFGPIDGLVRINRILENAGFLTPEQGASRDLLSSLGLTKDTVLNTAARFNLDTFLLERLPQSILERFAASVPGSHGLFDVDFSTTQAFAYGTRSIYINDDRFDEGIVQPSERAAVKDRVRAALEAVTVPNTSEPLLTVYDGDDIYPTDRASPDLIVEAVSGYLADTGLEGPVIGPADRDGAHEQEGIFLAWGADVAAGSSPTGATVFDVTPTILHGVGKSVPGITNGRVLTEIFEPDSEPGQRAVRTADYDDIGERGAVDADFSEVENRLRGLGYIE